MERIPVTQAKKKLVELLDGLAGDGPIALTRSGRVAGVLVSRAEWEGMIETIEILSDPKLMAQIRASRRSKKFVPFKDILKKVAISPRSTSGRSR